MSKVPEEWQEVVDYITSVTPKEMEIIEIRVIENKPKAHKEPAYLIEFDLKPVHAKHNYTITRQFNALAAKRYLEQLKRKENIN